MDQEKQRQQGEETSYQFDTPGTYVVRLTVTDKDGLSTSQEVKIEAGNEPPKVAIDFSGNESFYWNQKPIAFQVKVKDKEEGSLATGEITPDEVLVTVDVSDMGTDLTLLAQNQENASSLYLHPGQQFIKQSDCLACHQQEAKSIGPSWLQVAKRYKNDEKTLATLSQKIMKGGNGNWGQAAMSAHPQLKAEEVSEMVNYILDIGKEQQANNRLPVQGTYKPDSKAEGLYVFRALYKDKGYGNTPPQVGQASRVLRNAKVKAINCDENIGAIRYNNTYIRFPSEKSYITFNDVDMTGIENLKVAFATTFPCRLSFRLNKPDGPEIGFLDLQPTEAPGKNITNIITNWKEQAVMIKSLNGKHTLYAVATSFPENLDGNSYLSLHWVYFLPSGAHTVK